MMALPSQELNAPWVRRAIEATSNDLMVNRKAEVSCSPLYHATSALSIYLDRVTAVAPNIAQGAPKTHTISNSKEIKTTDAAFTRPVVDAPDTLTPEDVNSEAVKTPVMESSGVDSNGAPKALTGPVTTVPDVPVKTETGPLPTPSEATPEPKPATEPVATEPVAGEPVAGEPVAGEPIPPKVESGGEDTNVQPAEVAITPETTLKSAEGISQPELKVEPAAPSPAEVPAAPFVPAAPAAVAAVTGVAPTTTPAHLSEKTPATSAVSADKIRVFGPRPAPATHIAAKSNPPTDAQVPSTPVPLPSELLIALPQDQLVPTPIADPGSEQPMLVIPSTPLVVSTDLPPMTAEINSGNPDLLPLKTLTIPIQSAGSSRAVPNDKDHPPAEQPKEKKSERWKATPPERRKVIVVEEKDSGV